MLPTTVDLSPGCLHFPTLCELERGSPLKTRFRFGPGLLGHPIAPVHARWENHDSDTQPQAEIDRIPPLLVFLTYNGLYDYPLWRLSHRDLSCGPCAPDVALLAVTELDRDRDDFRPYSQNMLQRHLEPDARLVVLRYVINEGIISINEPIVQGAILLGYSYALRHEEDKMPQLSLWHTYLLLLAAGHSRGRPLTDASLYLGLFAKNQPDLRFNMSFQGRPCHLGEYLGRPAGTKLFSLYSNTTVVQEVLVVAGDDTIELCSVSHPEPKYVPSTLKDSEYEDSEYENSMYAMPLSWICWPPLGVREIIAMTDIEEEDRKKILAMLYDE
jgi:hypothetical protein